MNTETYRGYRIVEVWKYYNGTPYVNSDWEVYRGDQENGTVFHRKTISEVKASIDELLEEQTIKP